MYSYPCVYKSPCNEDYKLITSDLKLSIERLKQINMAQGSCFEVQDIIGGKRSFTRRKLFLCSPVQDFDSL
jgi:hypothetical protein